MSLQGSVGGRESGQTTPAVKGLNIVHDNLALDLQHSNPLLSNVLTISLRDYFHGDGFSPFL